MTRQVGISYKPNSSGSLRRNSAAKQIKPFEDKAKHEKDPNKARILWTRVCLAYYELGYRKEAVFALLIALAQIKVKEEQALLIRELKKYPEGNKLINQTKLSSQGRVNKLLRRARIHIGQGEFQAALNIYLCLAVELAGLDFEYRIKDIYFQALGTFWNEAAYDSACVIYKNLIKLDFKSEKKADIQLGFIGRCLEVVEKLPAGRQKDRLLSRASAFLRQVDHSVKPERSFRSSSSILLKSSFGKAETDIPEEIRTLWLKIAAIHQSAGRDRAASFAQDQATQLV